MEGGTGRRITEDLQSAGSRFTSGRAYVQSHLGTPARLKLLTQIRNLVYVFTLDQTTAGSKALRRDFTPETLEKIKTDTSFYRFSRKDEYSKGQEVLYLFGDTEENLILHLRKDGQNIIDHFNEIERSRLELNMFGTRSTQGVAAFLRKEQGIELRVPVGYVLADKAG